MNASSAVENQRVSICRLSGETKDVIVMALRIAHTAGKKWEQRDKRNRDDVIEELTKLITQIESSEEVWLIESKSS